MTARVAASLLALGVAASPGAAQIAAPRRPSGAAGTVIVPDAFLRRWDPVTVFFDRDLGPAGGGPEDAPERFVTVTPAHPGAFRWLDARTLQFRPADPWPSLARFTWKAGATQASLATLMAAPLQVVPAEGSEGLPPVESVTLSFPDPLDPAALARMTTIELRPLPGVGGTGARWLGRDDFEVKALERAERDGRAAYVLALKEPIGLGQKAIVHLRLSLDDRDAASFRQLAFATAEPFRVTALGCRDRQYPVSPEGSRYAREQAIRCASGGRGLIVEFSAPPRLVDAVAGRNLVRLTPAVDKLTLHLAGRTLEVGGEFAWDTLYAVSLAPAALADERGRPLEVRGRSELHVFFPRKPAYVRWGASQGILERHGAQMVPVEGRGQERVDLRIHRIDPLERSLWPFPDQPVTVDESRRPPGPGEEPEPHAAPDRPVTAAEIARQVAALGSPAVSTLVTLPLKRDGSGGSFGLDLAPHLERIAGRGQPGTYLVGLRDLGSNGPRSWMRLQVTDLSLATVEEPKAVRFVATSLSTGLPVAGATLRVEGTLVDHGASAWQTLVRGTTDLAGSFRWDAPGHEPLRSWGVRRIVVEHQGDVLVLDPSRPPEQYADNQWSGSFETWLQWTTEPLLGRGPQAETLAHVFTERPVYRPEDEVHVKGYLRRRERGRLAPVRGEAWLIVEGPGDLSWKFPVTLGEAGSFYQRFQEKQLPTGVYRAHVEDAKRQERWGGVSWQMEAYRIPRFEVSLHGPDRTPLDRDFEVTLTATYYAGGRVAGRPVEWRVTQFPHAWTPRPREGFRYSSDARFSRGERFESTPRLEKADVTSEAGSASLTLNPALEPSAQPRAYVIEATVVGEDDQTVTATRRVLALPPFVLGVKAPRFLEQARSISPEVLVVGPDGEPIAGKPVTVRLLRREWHSHLQASDFSDGVARYVTEVVDETLLERVVESAQRPLPVELPIAKAGVYVVELEARDRLERAQLVRVDLYAGGDEAVTWSKPVTRVFAVATDQARYEPGATASLVLESPFQKARALAVVEAPEGNRYEWIDVDGGAATYRVPIEGRHAPRLPVHFVLMRGRVAGTGPQPGNTLDLGKPATMAATAWLEVAPTAHQLTLELSAPETARPGQTVEVGIRLRDPKGRPLAGEVTLWLVDQAVLSLGKEQRLDPVPDFVTPVASHLVVRDTRNLAFGILPFAESPGGGAGEEEGGLLDRATVRKRFQAVPYFNPAIAVGPDGAATVAVKLPDDLTNFRLRAKAASGPERFGYATGTISVRLPVIVQPALPRFARPGDRFRAAAIGRIVEGAGGPGSAELRAEGVTLAGPARRELVFVPGRPEHLEFPVEVATPALAPDGRLARGEATFRVAVERASDGASDAFEVKLPIRDDRERVRLRVLEDLKPGTPVRIPALPEPARPGSVRRALLVSDQPGLVRTAAGLDFLLAYPYGCTEQQLSRARAVIALRRFRALLGQHAAEDELARAVREVTQWLPGVVDGNGLVAYWPGSDGYVSLTAWTVQFLVEARAAGFAVDEALLARLLRTLDQALRSDYGRFIDGESFVERAWALSALAQAGRWNAAYAAELARKAEYLGLEGQAKVLQSFAAAQDASSTPDLLLGRLLDGVVLRLHQGREVYGGLQDRPNRNGLILPGETRTLAEIARAVARRKPGHPKLPLLVDALVTLGRGDGWGSTNANASALLALSELLEPKAAGGAPAAVRVAMDGREQALSVGPASPVASASGTGAGAVEIVLDKAAARPVALRAETSYVPAADGSQVAPASQGFVVSRELLRVRPGGEPPERLPLERPGASVSFAVGDVVEEHVQVVNPQPRHYVAVVVPLAAGLEPLNPRLATAPPEAAPAGSLTRQPTYAAYLDDQVAFYYDSLPAGSYDFYFRTRATVPGSFVQPPAKAEMMYDGATRGSGAGARVTVERPEP